MRILVRQLDDMFSTLNIPGRIGINHFRLFDLSPNNIELRLQNWLDCSTIKNNSQFFAPVSGWNDLQRLNTGFKNADRER